jgi:uncharacterized repeat protein (TIGR01451 family)
VTDAGAIRSVGARHTIPDTLSFEPNVGQTAPAVRFLARGPQGVLFLTTAAAVTLRRRSAADGGVQPADRDEPPTLGAPTTPPGETASMQLKLVGGNPTPRAEGMDKLRGQSNYFLGHDPARWRTGIGHYARVKYDEVYPGIDVIFYGSHGHLEYDFLVAPGAEERRIRFELNGAGAARVDEDGNLIIDLGGAEVRQSRPVVYQDWDHRRHFLSGRYAVHGRQIAFDIAGRRNDKPLVIDPVLSYASFLGGGDIDVGHAVAVDAQDNVYVTGETASLNFPTAKAEQPVNAGGSDAFITKLDPAGNVLFSTYLGGSGNENDFRSGVESSGIAADAAGHVYVTGRTSSLDFPVVNAVLPNYGGGDYDGFVAMISAGGDTLLYATYLGGEANDSSNGIAVDGTGAIYVTGGTRSFNDFPITAGAYQPNSNGQLDAFVAKLDPSHSGPASLVYATYLGGQGIDRGTAVAVDASGNAHVVGRTESPDFPTTNALQAIYGGGADAFVAVLNSSGTGLIAATFLGGSGLDVANGVVVDVAGNTYITGETASADFPIVNGFQPTNAGSSDAFVAQLDPTGTALLYATYLGGSGLDRGTSLTLDVAAHIVITGETSSDDFPQVNAFQPARGGGKDVFVARIDPVQPGPASLQYASYLGGRADDVAFGLAVNSAGDAWVVGQTASADFPITNGIQAKYGGGPSDAFIARVSNATTPDYVVASAGSLQLTPGSMGTVMLTITPVGGFTGTVGFSIGGLPANAMGSFDPAAVAVIDGSAQTSLLTITTTPSTPVGIFLLTVTASSGALQHTLTVMLRVSTDTTVADLSMLKTAFPNPVQVGTNLTYRLVAFNAGPADAIGVQVTDTLPSVTLVSVTSTQGTCNGTSTIVCSIGALSAGTSATITVVVQPQAIGTISNTATVMADQPDPNPTNNAMTIVTTVNLTGTLPVDVLQHHLHPTRDGAYVDPLITQPAAAATHRDFSFTASLLGPVYAQPLYVNAGPGGTPAFLVATEQNDVFALAADGGTAIWQASLAAPVPRPQLPCGNIDPLGITGTPVIDPDRRAVYVAAMTTFDGGITKQHLIYALSLDDGSILPGWPVVVDGITFGGAVFNSATQNQRGALLLVDGILYVPYGGHFGDCGDYHGWVVAVAVDDPTSVGAWATGASQGGIWAAGGLASDGQSIFAVTGNTGGATDWMGGEAVLRLGAGGTFSGTPTDFFTPSNWSQLDVADLDLSGTGPVLITVPGATPTQLIVALGKNGVAYLVDPTNLGGIGTGDGTTGEGLQSKLVSSGIIRNAATAYATVSGTFVVFNVNTGTGIGCPATPGNLVALKIGPSAPPTIDVAWCADAPGRGSPIVTTIDGTTDPVVWTVTTEPSGANRLVAFDGETGAVLFAGGGPDEQMTTVRRFQAPIAVGGRVIVAADDQLFVFSTH